MHRIEEAVAWYQQTIGTYDKQLWEKSVETEILKDVQSMHHKGFGFQSSSFFFSTFLIFYLISSMFQHWTGIQNVPKKTARVKEELIDVDLVRGSTFSKAKPKGGFFAVVRDGLLRTLLLPLFFSWWARQTSLWFSLLLVFLYLLQISCTALYWFDKSAPSSSASPAHLYTPMTLALVLGLLHAQIAATHDAKKTRSERAPPLGRKTSTRRRRKRPRNNAKQSAEYTGPGSETEGSARGDEGAIFEKSSGEKSAGEQNTEEFASFPDESANLCTKSGVVNGIKTELKNEQRKLPVYIDEGNVVCGNSSENIEELQKPLPSSTGKLLTESNADPSCQKLSPSCDDILFQGGKMAESEIDPDAETEETITIIRNGKLKPNIMQHFNSSETDAKGLKDASGLRHRRTTTREVKPSRSLPCSLPGPSKMASFPSHRLSSFKEPTGVSSDQEDSDCPSSPCTPSTDQKRVGGQESLQTSLTSSGAGSESGSSFSDSDREEQETPVHHGVSAAAVLTNLANSSDKVSCVVWEGPNKAEAKKIDLTVLDLGWSIINKVDQVPQSSDYLMLSLIFSFLCATFPLLFRVYHTWPQDHVDWHHLLGRSWRVKVIVLSGMLQRLVFSLVFFFFLAVAERTFRQRLFYAKHFCYLTSSRRARKYDLPHFRLNKVRNIKTWLSLRSYLKKRGPQRSVDVIVSLSFLLCVILLSLMCVELLKDSDAFLTRLWNWDVVMWCAAIGIFLLRFMTLGKFMNRKYRNLSVLITEQINLYLHMEQKPHKKEELMLANNVLKLAEDLLKELESPFKISGLAANPFLYNITKLIILSAFSAVLTELLGFKLKLYKFALKS